MKLGVIGAGNMGSAIIRGWIAAGANPRDIIVKGHHPEKLAAMRDELGIKISEDSAALAAESDGVMIAVKPKNADEVLMEIAPHLRPETVIISIVAGKSISDIDEVWGKAVKKAKKGKISNSEKKLYEKKLHENIEKNVKDEEFRKNKYAEQKKFIEENKDVKTKENIEKNRHDIKTKENIEKSRHDIKNKENIEKNRHIEEGGDLKQNRDDEPVCRKIVRVMPNTPAMIGEGMSALCRSQSVSDEEYKRVETIFAGIGRVAEVPESMMDAVTGLSGSGPAYVYMFIEALADGAVMSGMPRGQAYEFAAQTVLGAAKMVLETGKHPGQLKDEVCSPAGTTIEAVRSLEAGGFRSSVIEAVITAAEKSKRL